MVLICRRFPSVNLPTTKYTLIPSLVLDKRYPIPFYWTIHSSSHVRMWELDRKKGWKPKNWCFRTMVLKKILESPLDCKEIKPVNLKEINPEYSLEGLMLKLKLQYFGHLIQRANSLEKTLMLGKTEGKRRRGQQRLRWLDSNTSSTERNFSKLRDIVEDRETWRAAVHGIAKSQTWLGNWTTTIPSYLCRPHLMGFPRVSWPHPSSKLLATCFAVAVASMVTQIRVL